MTWLGMIFLFVTLAAAPEARAQAGVELFIALNETAQSDSIYIGDLFNVQVEVKHRRGEVVKWPNVLPTMPLYEGERRSDAVLEVLDRTETDTTFLDDGTVRVVRRYQVMILESGEFSIPPWKFQLLTESAQNAQDLRTTSKAIRIHAPLLDAADEPRAIKQPLTPPFNWWPIVWYCLAALVLTSAAYYIWKKYQKRTAPEPELIEVPRIIAPADKTALNALRALEKDALWQKGQIKEYYTRISEILRTYLEEQFGMAALESTSDDILRQFAKQSPDAPELQKSLRQILQLADLVKFARTVPTEEDHQYCLREAYSFVEKSTALAVKRAESAAGAAAEDAAGTTANNAEQTAGQTAPTRSARPGHAAFVPPNMRAQFDTVQGKQLEEPSPKLSDSRDAISPRGAGEIEAWSREGEANEGQANDAHTSRPEDHTTDLADDVSGQDSEKPGDKT